MVIRGHGFTLVEVLVVIGVILLIGAILFPVLARSKDESKKSVSMANLKQIHVSALLYGQDYDCYDEIPGLGTFPLHPINGGVRELFAYGVTEQMLKSPLAEGSPDMEMSCTYTFLPPFPKDHPKYNPGLKGRFAKLQEKGQSYSIIQDQHLDWKSWQNTTNDERLKLQMSVLSLTLGGSIEIIKKPVLITQDPDDPW